MSQPLDPDLHMVTIPMELLYRVESILKHVRDDYSVKPIPTWLWNEMNDVLDEIKRIQNGEAD